MDPKLDETYLGNWGFQQIPNLFWF